MKSRFLKRIISFILAMCVCISLLPGTPAKAFSTAPADLASAAKYASSWETADKDWSGMVVLRSKEDADGKFLLTVGAYNVPESQSYILRLKYDTTVVSALNSSGSVTTNAVQIRNAIQYLEPPVSAFTSPEVAGGWSGMTWTDTGLMEAMASGTADFGTEGNYRTCAFDFSAAAYSTDLADVFANHSTTSGAIAFTADQGLMEFFTIPLKVNPGQKIESDTFQLYAQGNVTYGAMTATAVATSYGAYFINFPAPPEASGSASVTVEGVEGIDVTLTGTSAAGTDLSTLNLTGKTDVSGSVTFAEVPVGSNYTCTATGVGTKNGASWQVKDASKTQTFSVTANNNTALTYGTETLEEVVASYPMKVIVQDMKGNALAATGAAVSLGGSAASATVGGAGNNEITFTTATSGDAKELQVSGITGYQPRKVSLNMTPVDGSTSALSTVVLSNSADSSFASAAVQAGQGVVTLKMAKVAANVEIPLPVPSGDDAMSSEEITNITANFKPTTQDAIDEVGANGVTLTQDNGGIIVTIDDTTKKITGIKLNATLPAGTYNVTITGNGMTTINTTVIIKKSGSDTVVNVGGTEQEDGTITGGITGTTPESGNTDANGNVNVDMGGSGNTTVTEGGTVGSDGSVSGGTALPGGTGNAGNTDLAPGVMSDPVYIVDMSYVDKDSSNPYVLAKVSIKNVTDATAGTFGLEYDPKIFTAMKGKTADDVILNMNSAIEYSIAVDNEPQVVYPEDTDQPAYVTVAWNMKDSQSPIKPASDLFEIKLFGDLTLKDAITKGNFSDASVNVMPYQETANGQHLKQLAINAAGGNASGDDYTYWYNQLMTQIWREVGQAGQKDCVKLADSLAKRGGFYQFSQYNADVKQNAPHDIAVELRYPTDIPKHFAAEFLIQEATTTPTTAPNAIGGATIKVYNEVPTVADKVITTTPYVTLKTSEFGRAAASVDAGTYYYTVTHPSFWDYPDGTVTTDTDGILYDTLTVDEYGVITMKEHTLEDSTKFITKIDPDTGYINPRMEAKSYHKVSIEKDTSSAAWSIPEAKFSSLDKAYNKQDYYFTITPPTGYDWDTTSQSMADIAAAIKAKLHGINAAATTAENDMYRSGEGTPITVSWDTTRKQFKIVGDTVVGDAVGDVTFTGDVPDWYNSLRSGDIVLPLKADMFKTKDMKLTVTAGAGGTITTTEPDPARPTDGGESSSYTPNGGNSSTPPTAGQSKVEETLSGGRTDSADYTFVPDANNQIDKVIVNGVEIPLTEPQKKEFTYQFTNVSGDESIVVTFVDVSNPDNPVPQSAPAVTVILGDNGTAAVTDGGTAANPASLTGPATQIYTGTAGQAFVVTPSTDAAYEVDKIIVKDIVANTSTVLTEKAELTADQMVNGKAYTVMITFKEKNGPSTQVIVDASVDAGLGYIYPAGIAIHTVNETPSYTMKPFSGSWFMDQENDAKALLVAVTGGTTVDHSDKLVKDDANKLYSYTLEPLVADTMLRASFTETGVQVKGILQVAVAAGKTDAAEATITFEREKDETNMTDATKITVTTGTAVATNGDTRLMSFGATVPKGTWKVTVSKHGYLHYIITGFEVTDSEAVKPILFGIAADDTSATEAKPIVLTPGDAAGDGMSIGSSDVAMVAAGWVNGAYPKNRVMSDVDESSYGTADSNRYSDSADMTLVTNNYTKLRQYMTYDAFKAL